MYSVKEKAGGYPYTSYLFGKRLLPRNLSRPKELMIEPVFLHGLTASAHSGEQLLFNTIEDAEKFVAKYIPHSAGNIEVYKTRKNLSNYFRVDKNTDIPVFSAVPPVTEKGLLVRRCRSALKKIFDSKITYIDYVDNRTTELSITREFVYSAKTSKPDDNIIPLFDSDNSFRGIVEDFEKQIREEIMGMLQLIPNPDPKFFTIRNMDNFHIYPDYSDKTSNVIYFSFAVRVSVSVDYLVDDSSITELSRQLKTIFQTIDAETRKQIFPFFLEVLEKCEEELFYN